MPLALEVLIVLVVLLNVQEILKVLEEVILGLLTSARHVLLVVLNLLVASKIDIARQSRTITHV